MPLSPVIMLHPDDDVAIARVPLANGDTLPGFGIKAADPIPFGHKIAVRDLPTGAPVKR
jgi:altronate hydrolase